LPSVTGRNHIDRGLVVEASCDYALRKQRPMIRAYNAIIAAVVNTITYSIVLFG
jgi:hypothetical protein